MSKKVIMLIAAVIGAALLVSGCCGVFENTGYTVTEPSPNVFLQSPTPTPMPGISSFFNANEFEYTYTSEIKPATGTAPPNFESTRQYKYTDTTLPDGTPGYRLTVNETFKGANNGQMIVANFTKKGNCTSASRWATVNGRIDSPAQDVKSSASQYDLKNNPQIKFEGATKNLTTKVNAPLGSYDAQKYSTKIGGSIYMANNVPVPVKIEIVSPCGEVFETFELNKFMA